MRMASGALWLVMVGAAMGVGCSGGGKPVGGDSGGAAGGSDGGGSDGGGSDGGGGGNAYSLSDFINVSDAPSGDLSGFEGGFEGQGAWISQTVDESLIADVSMSGKVEDFESGEGVPEATVELYYADEIGGVPDVSFTSASDGTFSGTTGRTCTAVAYKAATDPALGDTKNTFERHQVFNAGSSLDEIFNSVSTATYALIPGLLGINVDPDKGTAAGTVYDSNGDPVEGAQIVVVDADGKIPNSLVVNYFVDDFPNRDQPYTSPDGLWVAVNIPEGNWQVDAYVSDGAGGHIRLATSAITVYQDSINISNLWTGYDSVRYPDSCLATR